MRASSVETSPSATLGTRSLAPSALRGGRCREPGGGDPSGS
ncbi:hypothetical protein A33M_2957 [Rhodovulum sp. PH10]|nr:hypothetical protein A33M_2957 [Rhodovulum sp. PH10]